MARISSSLSAYSSRQSSNLSTAVYLLERTLLPESRTVGRKPH
jgi:hypothetical protein